MDGVLVDFQSGINLLSDKELALFQNNFDEVPGIFSRMKPIDGALEAFEKLNKHTITIEYSCSMNLQYKNIIELNFINNKADKQNIYKYNYKIKTLFI